MINRKQSLNLSSMSLSLKETNFCLKLIDELSDHAIAGIFMEPVDPINDGVPDYLSIIKYPSDLSTVKKRLKNGEYSTIQSFKRDVNLIWENAREYNGNGSLPAFCADELSRIFRKRIAEIEEMSQEQWIDEFLKNRSSLCRLFRNAPKGLASFSFGTEQIMPPTLEQSISGPMTPNEASFFEEHQNLFNEIEIQEKLNEIIEDNKPIPTITRNNIVEVLQNLNFNSRFQIRNIIEEYLLSHPIPKSESSEKGE